MKKILNSKNKILANPDGTHSFLFWLVIPVLIAWLSIGYIRGITADKPLWASNTQSTTNENEFSPYFSKPDSGVDNLDQPFVTFWFDDAWLSQYMNAYPILKKNGFVGTIAISTNPIETAGYMNWAQLRVMQKNGWETNNHSKEHNCSMQDWEVEKIRAEFGNSRRILWKNKLGSDIFVSPCGVDSKTMRDEAMKLFMGFRTVDPGFNDPKNFDPYGFKVKNIENKTTLTEMKGWVDEAKKSNLWLILLFHKVGEPETEVGNGDQYNTTTENFEEIVRYVKESKIKVVIPSQIISSQEI